MNAPNPQINRARLLPELVKRLLFVAILTVVANYFSGDIGLESIFRCTSECSVWE